MKKLLLIAILGTSLAACESMYGNGNGDDGAMTSTTEGHTQLSLTE